MRDTGYYRGKTVAVTGASGYIGAALLEAIAAAGARVLAISRRAIDPPIGVETIQADVRSADCWTDIVSRADVIFHLAGTTSVREAAIDPAASEASTITPLQQIADCAHRLGRVPTVVFTSTATVYGLTEQLPVGEDHELRPITTYDRHKLRAEHELAHASNDGRVAGVSLRIANVYGPSPGRIASSDRGVLNAIAARALRGDDLDAYGDGRCVRDYVYVDDVVRALVSVGAHPELRGQAFNVGSGAGTVIRDAFELVAERGARVSGRRSLVRFVPWPDGAEPIDQRNFTANIDRLNAACGWRPRMALRDGIDRLIEHLAARRSGVS